MDELVFISPAQWKTFSTWLFIDQKISNSYSSMTAIRSRYHILCTYFAEVPFNRGHFSLFLQQRHAKGDKPAYLNNFIKLAKQIARYHKLEELEDYTYFKEVDEVYEVLTFDEMRAMATIEIPYLRRKAEQNTRQKSLITLLAQTGMRISEVLNLKFADVFDGYLIVRETKNYAQRYVPITPQLSRDMHTLPHLSEVVFNLRDDSQVSEDIKRRAAAINCTKRVWNHLFRHSYCTLNLNRGMDPLMVGKIVGHKSPGSTLRYDQRQLASMTADQYKYNPFFQEGFTDKQLKKIILEQISDMYDKEKFNVTVTVVAILPIAI